MHGRRHGGRRRRLKSDRDRNDGVNTSGKSTSCDKREFTSGVGGNRVSVYKLCNEKQRDFCPPRLCYFDFVERHLQKKQDNKQIKVKQES